MFWGKVLKEGEPYKVQHALEDGDYPVLHLSSAVLGKSDGNSKNKTVVQVAMGKDLKGLQIAVLTPERQEVQALDLYLNISQDITISVRGKGEVHLAGYFEPNSSLEDQMFGQDLGELEDEESEEESEEEVPAAKKAVANGGKPDPDVQGFKKGGDLDKSLKAANKNTIKNSMDVESDSDDEESEDEDDDEDEEFEQVPGLDLEAEEGEEESDDDDENEDESEDDEVLQKLQNLKKKQAA